MGNLLTFCHCTQEKRWCQFLPKPKPRRRCGCLGTRPKCLRIRRKSAGRRKKKCGLAMVSTGVQACQCQCCTSKARSRTGSPDKNICRFTVDAYFV
ncbi:hypothetical protein JYU34_020560 [Plutella xylostella]|uniref:Uncharacterized protein n=2 Tax=Plutella xylostella TaxID=51655 RepID=A0ABQ7PUZ0_PLUXY|nr:hypothetical protein JYU34_020560 [Plutella xylostella]CAG9122373.1 unnamed protein product [Plutella xylostella]